jgi:hypothetical protein
MKAKHSLIMQSRSHTPLYLPKGGENLCPHKNVHIDAYSSFINDCQNLEAAKMSFGR